MKNDTSLEIIPLGGVGEFGMNSTAIRYGEDMILIDVGMMFPEDDLLGIDRIVPDFSFLKEHQEQLRAVILTHVHEDHVGALPYLLRAIPVPVYGTRFTIGMIEGRLIEHGLDATAETIVVEPRDVLEIGPFEIEFIRVTHSTSDCVSLAITTPVGVVVHTGDFKIDDTPIDGELTDFERLNEYGDRGVLALLADSTNIDRPGRTGSEESVAPSLAEVFETSTGRIIVSCFSTSTHRQQIVADLARETGRKIAILGRSMIRNTEIASSLGYLELPIEQRVAASDLRYLPDDEIVIIASGCQGEPMSALGRMAVGSLKQASVEAGDVVVLSARFIPGNERPISRMMGHIYRRGARVIDNSIARVHVSGHASQEDLALYYDAVRPKFLLPIHGEFRQLFRHKEFAVQRGIPPERVVVAENGDVVSFDGERMEICGKVNVGKTFIDLSGVDELGDEILRDRKHLASDGVLLPVIALNMNTGAIEDEIRFISRGFQTGEAAESVERRMSAIVGNVMEFSDREEKSDPNLIREKIRVELKRYIQKELGKRPMIVPIVVEI